MLVRSRCRHAVSKLVDGGHQSGDAVLQLALGKEQVQFFLPDGGVAFVEAGIDESMFGFSDDIQALGGRHGPFQAQALRDDFPFFTGAVEVKMSFEDGDSFLDAYVALDELHGVMAKALADRLESEHFDRLLSGWEVTELRFN